MYHDPRLKNEFHVRLIIADFECSPEEISEKLGIEPTNTRRKGDYIRIGKGKHERKMLNKQNLWLLRSQLSQNSPVEEHIQYILNKVKPFEKNLITLAKKYYVEIGCALYYHEANPGIHMDSDLLKKLADLHIKLDLDIYCLAGTQSQFEYPDAEKELEKQFSKVNFISSFNKNDHNEPKKLAKSLIAFDEALHNLDMYMEDLVIWEDLSEDLYKEKFERVNKNLRSIIKNIKNSKYLSSVVTELKDKKS